MATRIERVGVSAGKAGLNEPSFLARIRTWLDSRQRMSRTVSELGSLTDRELEDIGLNRADITNVARARSKV